MRAFMCVLVGSVQTDVTTMSTDPQSQPKNDQADVCPHLRVLELDDTDMTDAGLAAVARALKHGTYVCNVWCDMAGRSIESTDPYISQMKTQGTAPTSPSSTWAAGPTTCRARGSTRWGRRWRRSRGRRSWSGCRWTGKEPEMVGGFRIGLSTPRRICDFDLIIVFEGCTFILKFSSTD